MWATSVAYFCSNRRFVQFVWQFFAENIPDSMTCVPARSKKNRLHVTPKSTLSHTTQGYARFFMKQNVAGQDICLKMRYLSCAEETHQFSHCLTSSYLKSTLISSSLRLRAAVGLLTGHATLRAQLYEIGHTEAQECRLCGYDKEDCVCVCVCVWLYCPSL